MVVAMIPIISHRWQHLYPFVKAGNNFSDISWQIPPPGCPWPWLHPFAKPTSIIHRGVTWHDWLGPIKIVPGTRVSLAHRSTGPSNPWTQLGFWWQATREAARKELAGHQPGATASLWSLHRRCSSKWHTSAIGCCWCHGDSDMMTDWAVTQYHVGCLALYRCHLIHHLNSQKFPCNEIFGGRGVDLE